MVDGSFCCLGTSQHLKSKYAMGYQVEITYTHEKAYEDCLELCKNISIDFTIEEKYGLFIRVKFDQLHLGTAFKVLQDNKENPNERNRIIVDYTISQNTLEQVLIKFARLQESEQIDNVTKTQDSKSNSLYSKMKKWWLKLTGVKES